MSDHNLAEQFDSPLGDFQEGQWWVLELDAAARENDATSDFKRAVAVVHHLLRALRTNEAEQQAGEAVAWASIMGGKVMNTTNDKVLAEQWEAMGGDVRPLYTHPQQPLTDRQLRTILTGSPTGYITDTVRGIAVDVQNALLGITK